MAHHLRCTLFLLAATACDAPEVTTASNPLVYPGETAVGCYVTTATSKAMSFLLAAGGQTPDSCRALGAALGYPFVGLENGGDCYAGAAYGWDRAAAESCNTPCTANPAVACGGSRLPPQGGALLLFVSAYLTQPMPASACTYPGDGLHECLSPVCADVATTTQQTGWYDAYAYSPCISTAGPDARRLAHDETMAACRRRYGHDCLCVQYSPPNSWGGNDCQRILALGYTEKPNASPTVLGYVDGVTPQGTDVLVSGWACMRAQPASIDVRIYAGDPQVGGALVATARADQWSEQAVAAACNATGSAYRYRVAVPNPAAYAGQRIHVLGVSTTGTTTALTNSGAFAVPQPPAAQCGNGACEPGETGASCGADCCDGATPCWVTQANQGQRYCRSMNGGGYAWLTATEANAYCDDTWEIGASTYSCGGSSGTCCSIPGGWVGGSCW